MLVMRKMRMSRIQCTQLGSGNHSILLDIADVVNGNG
jgi:hypothetical protein